MTDRRVTMLGGPAHGTVMTISDTMQHIRIPTPIHPFGGSNDPYAFEPEQFDTIYKVCQYGFRCGRWFWFAVPNGHLRPADAAEAYLLGLVMRDQYGLP